MGYNPYPRREEAIVAKTFAEYSAERRSAASAADAVAFEVFDRAYALGSELADARRTRGLNQRQLAELTGINQGDISRIERGVLAPTSPTLMRLAAGLGARIAIQLLPEDASSLGRTRLNSPAARKTAPRKAAQIKVAARKAASGKVAAGKVTPGKKAAAKTARKASR
jgi:XRE family transcriptional regulator, regulator of sulfur utilization